MVYRIQAELGFTSVAIRDQVERRIATFKDRPQWGSGTTFLTSLSGFPALVVEVYFTSQADRDALVADIDSYLKGPRAPRAGYYSFATCTEDLTLAQPCSDEVVRRF